MEILSLILVGKLAASIEITILGVVLLSIIFN